MCGVYVGSVILDLDKPGPLLAHNSTAALAQVAWVGRSGHVYGYGCPKSLLDMAEPDGCTPLYAPTGSWVYRGYGQYVVEGEGFHGAATTDGS